MKFNKNRILFFLASISLLAIFLFPVWRITMGIPQYPKDITIHIRINRLVNGTEKAMEIINVLNHNIGMKAIEPSSIPELRYFPWIIIVMAIAGAGLSLSNSNKPKIIWMVMLLLFCITAMIDFYIWEYDYGHDLDPAAPIKIEGSSFQPPLIGTKTIINFTVSSWPMPGAVFPVVSFILAWISIKMNKKV